MIAIASPYRYLFSNTYHHCLQCHSCWVKGTHQTGSACSTSRQGYVCSTDTRTPAANVSHTAASYHIPSKPRADFKETTATVAIGGCLSSDDAQTLVRALLQYGVHSVDLDPIQISSRTRTRYRFNPSFLW